MDRTPDFDIIVVGAGHAACEAALAASRLGRRVLALTISLRHVAEMPCNPAIGGLAKGQLVREIDALGGEMGRAIDETGIHFRMLNTGKGPAVRSPRAQADKVAYHRRMLAALRSEPNLTVREGRVEELLIRGGRVHGVGLTDRQEVTASAVILTTGTFLCGRLHVGLATWRGGRTGERSAMELSRGLESAGLPLMRLKTGTPPRVARESVDWDEIVMQRGDVSPQPFSFSTQSLNVDQVDCAMTSTDACTHAIVRSGADRAPLFTGQIEGIGPRYCPSIEDKVVRFAGRDSHRVILEPEVRDGRVIYLNGLATSLPYDVQVRMVRSIRGLARARLVRPGYAVEYDAVDPRQLNAGLETRAIQGLYLAGQINGTSGYEEAAAQGLIAGVNAARALDGEESVVLARSQAYIGVLIDDLVTKGADEPYRMFTSRAEHRLVLRQDNADLRLRSVGHEIGLVSDEAHAATESKRERIKNEVSRLISTRIDALRANGLLRSLGASETDEPTSLERLLVRPEVSVHDIESLAPAVVALTPEEREQVEIEIKYRGYVARAREQVARMERLEGEMLPEGLEYTAVHGLSTEAQQKLSRVRPRTVAQAGRIPGVSPADLGVLMIHLAAERRRREIGGRRRAVEGAPA